jgi:hypothetical protein
LRILINFLINLLCIIYDIILNFKNLMTASIYLSKIRLLLKNENYEKQYQAKRLLSTKYWIYALSCVALMMSIVNFHLQYNHFRHLIKENDFPFPYILGISYVSLGLNGICHIIILVQKNLKWKQFFYYFQYLLLWTAFFCLNFSISFYEKNPGNYHFLYGIESFVKILNCLVFLEFKDSVILSGLSFIWIASCYAFFQEGHMEAFLCSYLFFNLTFLLISYCVVYLRRTCFYLSEENRKKKDWYKKII